LSKNLVFKLFFGMFLRENPIKTLSPGNISQKVHSLSILCFISTRKSYEGTFCQIWVSPTIWKQSGIMSMICTLGFELSSKFPSLNHCSFFPLIVNVYLVFVYWKTHSNSLNISEEIFYSISNYLCL